MPTFTPGTMGTLLQRWSLSLLEQGRVLSAFSSYLDAVRQGAAIEPLRNSVRPMIREMDEFLTEARLRHPSHEMEAVSSMLAQQRLIVWLEEQFAALCAELNELPDGGLPVGCGTLWSTELMPWF